MANQLIPQLRFPKYSDEWNKDELKKITSYVDYRGRAPKKSEKGHFLVTAKNIKKGFIDYEVSKEFVAIEDYSTVMSKGLPNLGDVLFTTEAPMGNVAQINNESIALAQRVIKFRGEITIQNSFLLYYMLSNVFQKTIKKKAIGTTVQGISGKELHKTIIKYPLIEEQQKIAAFLTDVDDKINKITKKKDLLEQYKKGVMQRIFKQELRFKDDNGFDFSKWEVKKLGAIGSIVSGLTYSPNDINANGVLVLRSSNVKKRLIALNDNVFVNVEKGKFNPVELNDILICVRNGSKRLIGKNAIIKEEHIGLAFGAFMTVYRSKYNRFLFHFFDSQHYKKEVHKNLGATINSINGGDLKKFKVPFPCIAEQTKIADFLSDIDVKIEALNTKIENSKNFKKGLLQKMFV